MKNERAANEKYVTGTKTTYINSKDKSAIDLLANCLALALSKTEKTGKLIICCIGTDRSTGDSLGPLVGTMLGKSKIKVIGNLENPLHAKNLSERTEKLKDSKDIIIAVDACLGRMDHVEQIIFTNGPLKPGTGVGKTDLNYIGDFSISPIVNFGGFQDFLILQNTRLNVVYNMAQIVSKSIIQANQIYKRKTSSKIGELVRRCSNAKR